MLQITEEQLEQMAVEYAVKAKDIDIAYMHGLFYGYIAGFKQAIEEIKNQSNA